MKDDAYDHSKMLLLARDLKYPLWAINGLVDRLWYITRKQAPRGDIGRLLNEEIAVRLHWEGDPDELIAALVKRKLLDAVDDRRRLIVHDWPEHCEDGIHVKLARAVETFADGTMPKLTRFSRQQRAEIEAEYAAKGLGPTAAAPAEGPRPHPQRDNRHERPEAPECATERSEAPESTREPTEARASDRKHAQARALASPCLATPCQKPPPTPRGGVRRAAPHPGRSPPGGGRSSDDDFARFWAAYPRKVGKRAAQGAFRNACRRAEPDRIIEAAAAFAASPAGQRGIHTPYPASWLNGDRFDDDRDEWQRQQETGGSSKGAAGGAGEARHHRRDASVYANVGERIDTGAAAAPADQSLPGS